jgi:hypothetical protein
VKREIRERERENSFINTMLGCREKVKREKNVRENMRREKDVRNRSDFMNCLV